MHFRINPVGKHFVLLGTDIKLLGFFHFVLYIVEHLAGFMSFLFFVHILEKKNHKYSQCFHFFCGEQKK